MSVVKCTVIVRPLTHFTIFTDRVLRSVICAIWTWSLLVAVIANLGVIRARFNWTTMMVVMRRRHLALIHGFLVTGIVVSTLIIMTAYIKVFLVVRRQVREIRVRK